MFTYLEYLGYLLRLFGLYPQNKPTTILQNHFHSTQFPPFFTFSVYLFTFLICSPEHFNFLLSNSNCIVINSQLHILRKEITQTHILQPN